MKNTNSIREKNINDFSNQWLLQNDLKKGFWTDKKWLENICEGVFELSIIKNKIICEVGSGSGRIVNMLKKYKPKQINCVEPSKNIEVLKKNIQNIPFAEVHNVMGHQYDLKNLDYVFSIGVIHHIVDPLSTVKNIYKSLKKNGEFVMWVYGYEGNEFYIFIYKFLSFFTTKINDNILEIIISFFNFLLIPYIYISRVSKYFPMHSYLKNVFSKCTLEHRKFIIFDQLNPSYSKYYKKDECLNLLKSAGFKNIKIKRFNNYSWVLKGSK